MCGTSSVTLFPSAEKVSLLGSSIRWEFGSTEMAQLRAIAQPPRELGHQKFPQDLCKCLLQTDVRTNGGKELFFN